MPFREGVGIRSSRVRSAAWAFAIVGLVGGFGPGPVPGAAARGQQATTGAKPQDDRARALELVDEHRDLEALPLLEALAKANPADREVQERLAQALVTQSATVKPEEGAALRRRARAILVELKKTGDLSDLSELLASGIPADGAMPSFSTNAEVAAAIKEGEAAFGRRDFEAARAAYTRAIRLDPGSYIAALFVGDTYFAEGKLREAGTWFERAIVADRDQESAHRYLGDTHVRAGRPASARLCYVDAIIAEPYKRQTWAVLARWAEANKVRFGHPRVIPEELDPTEAGGDASKAKAAAAVKPGGPDDGRSEWHRYAEARAAWAKSKFKEAHPAEPAYRHSLAEEVDALRQVARAIEADVKSGRVKEPHPCFAQLIRLDKDGLLEAHILYARADAGIAKDYEGYRASHRGELRRYLSTWVVPFEPRTAEGPGATSRR
ncbi:Tetratricopeptide repeat protein [Aquisphaera giovannonii]|uniref:Tetratricopeptide repeat protein n=1 Tax=Aquisphaera giovannonii TaxID=406548 RepID=A0A5B9VTK6_9BACT|nr:tetratricopeptide repeat protein [Aquisphaera giovannonii]QEH31612.1 Tetratricopeptide repeat protein [Aquisphaera giovannonii]